MAVTDQPTAAIDLRPFQPVVIDLYRDIHKGIRTELFAVTTEAGRVDPADDAGRVALTAQVRDVVEVLELHAHHEDSNIQPTLEVELPVLAERIAAEHEAIDGRLAQLVDLADEAADGSQPGRREQLHRLYLELATFTGEYLAHQDVEERVVMPALEAAIGVEATGAINHAIVSSIPPDEMARSLAFMLPAMNLDDRAELLGGMQAGAPAEVFAGVWSLAGSVLETADFAALGRRLGLA